MAEETDSSAPLHDTGLVRFCSIVTKFLTQMGKLMEEGSVRAHSF